MTMFAGDLETIADVLTDAATAPLWSCGDAALVSECETLHRLEQRLAGLKLRVLAEIDHRGLARELGATSTTAWVRWRLRLPAGTAARMVRLARSLVAYRATASALAAGDVTAEQA